MATLSNEHGIKFQMLIDNNETHRGGFKVWETRRAQGFRKMIKKWQQDGPNPSVVPFVTNGGWGNS